MLDVYAAGEKPIVGADSRSLCRTIRNRGRIDPIFVAEHQQLPQVLENILQDGDLLLTQGAGNVGKIAKDLASIHLNVSQALIKN